MKSSVKNIFVFGADTFNMSQMVSLHTAKRYRFHELFSYHQVKTGPEFPVRQIHKKAIEILKQFPGSIDAIIGYWDFPVSTMLPLLRHPYGLPSPSFEAVLKCEHKYWSRLEQYRVIPEYIPDFCVVDPFAGAPRQHIHIDYPFWIKPVKAVCSHLGFKVRNDAELDHAVRLIRENIFRFSGPFNYLLKFAGKWCSYSATPDLPHDQREEDGGALLFTTAPLQAPLEILGSPVLELELSANRPMAMVAVRLSDMRPDNKVTRITYGVLNLTHRDSHGSPSPLEPDRLYRVRVQLNDVAQTFPKGHRIRIAISSSYFPLAWPPPQSTQLKIHTGKSRLILPARTPREESIHFPEAEASAGSKQSQITEGHHNWRVIRQLDKDISTLEVINDNGTYQLEDIDLTVQRKAEEWYSYQGDDFNTAKGETRWTRSFERGHWQVRTVTRTILHCDETYFYLDAELDAYEGDRRVYSKNWNLRIKRNLV